MTAGIPSSTIAPAQGLTFNVTVVNSAPAFGYSFGSFGSMSPSTYYGGQINLCYSTTGWDIALELSGVVSATFIRGIVVLDTAGVWRNLAASAASFASGRWTWGSGASKVWTAIGTRTLIVY